MSEVAQLFSLYRNRGILIDTNILLLLFVGLVNRDRISQFNRTEKFLPEDFDLLVRIIEHFQKVITTPNVLTELSSLINQLGEPERSQCYTVFTQQMNLLDEFYLESQEISQLERFPKFGLTDLGILQLAKGKYLVLTDDLRFTSYLQSMEVDVVNFNNIRVSGWK
jgi:hypothetical protein